MHVSSPVRVFCVPRGPILVLDSTRYRFRPQSADRGNSLRAVRTRIGKIGKAKTSERIDRQRNQFTQARESFPAQRHTLGMAGGRRNRTEHDEVHAELFCVTQLGSIVTGSRNYRFRRQRSVAEPHQLRCT